MLSQTQNPLHKRSHYSRLSNPFTVKHQNVLLEKLFLKHISIRYEAHKITFLTTVYLNIYKYHADKACALHVVW
jgi:hypothetical protein